LNVLLLWIKQNRILRNNIRLYIREEKRRSAPVLYKTRFSDIVPFKRD